MMWLVFWATAGFFSVSLAMSLMLFPERLTPRLRPWQHSKMGLGVFAWCVIAHGIGFLGIVKYVVDYGASLGSVGDFGSLLIYESYKIRQANEVTTSIGFQVSYIGWIAIGLSLLSGGQGTWQKRIVYALCGLQFLCNCLFIDRTRPTWILFICFICIVYMSQRISRKTMLFYLGGLPLFFVTLFIIIGAWIGKTDFSKAFMSDNKAQILEGPIYYASCGFAYLNWAVDHVDPSRLFLERSLYPAYKVYSLIDPTKLPMSQVNEFVSVPLPTNVGTFIEPFIRDAGLVFAVFGMIVHSFIFDFLAAYLRRQGSAIGIFLLGNICFTTFIGFFTPKANSFPIWLFILVWLLSGFVATFVDQRHQYHAKGNSAR